MGVSFLYLLLDSDRNIDKNNFKVESPSKVRKVGRPVQTEVGPAK